MIDYPVTPLNQGYTCQLQPEYVDVLRETSGANVKARDICISRQ